MSHNLITAVIGRKGSGKSTITREMIAERDRVVVVDTLAEYGSDCGCEVVDGYDACLDALADSERRRKFKLALRCLDVDENLDLIGVCYEIPNHLVVIEEASMFASPSSLPPEIAQLIRYGRHRSIDQIYIARRPAELHRDVTANADLLITFQTQEPRDLLYLRGFYGDEALELSRLPLYEIKVFGDMSKAPRSVLYRLAEQN